MDTLTMMHRTHTYTAKLTKTTQHRLTAFLEQQRLLYNAALEERVGAYRKAQQSITGYDQFKSLTQIRHNDPDFAQYDVKCQRSALFTLDRAFKAFFRRVKAGQKPGFPRFKGRDRGVRSFSTSTPRLKQHGQWWHLSMKGIGRLRFKGEIDGAVVKARVVKTPRRVTIQLLVEHEAPAPNPQRPLGIDVGIQARATLSDGTRWTKNEISRERLTHLQQRLSSAKRGSQRRQKCKQMMAREWQRIRERERGILHGMTADLVKRTNCYFVEDLNVQGMMGNHRLARSIAEQQWATFVSLLTYKAESAGGWVQKVDARYTSQDCSRCGTRVQKTLSDRLHVCPDCGLSIDRDWNAAINVLNRGLAQTSSSPGGTSPGGTIGAENNMLA